MKIEKNIFSFYETEKHFSEDELNSNKKKYKWYTVLGSCGWDENEMWSKIKNDSFWEKDEKETIKKMIFEKQARWGWWVENHQNLFIVFYFCVIYCPDLVYTHLIDLEEQGAA